MLAIYKKEMRSYFINPIGYVFLGVFLTVAAAICSYTTLQSRSYSTSNYFYVLILVMIVIIPLLTMRTFAEERKMRTEQMLLTAPVSITGMVMGKFLAAFSLFGGALIVSCINLIPLYIVGARDSALSESTSATISGPNTPQIIGSLLGVLLIGAAFIAIGVFISSLTENQLSAAVLTIGALALMLVLNIINQIGSEENGTRLINNYVLRYVIDWVSVISRYSYFSAGYLDWAAIIYYVSLVFVFLFLTARVYERRRWA
jgi:ABC-2 type transport system permease protein